MSKKSGLNYAVCLAALVALTGCQPTIAQSHPEIDLVPGQTMHITAQRIIYSKVNIPAGATLIINEGTGEAMQMIVQGDFKLQGKIVARRWNSAGGTYRIALPTGKLETIEIQRRNVGGRGGSGGWSGGNGGAGASGTTDYGGGGGGGGADATWQGGPGYVNGSPGDGVNAGRGAVPGACGADGGDGASRPQFGNGGVIYLEVKGSFDATGGLIDLSGEPGANGNDGKDATHMNTPRCGAGHGGSGGGAPGGQGGVLLAYIKGPIVQYPRMVLDFGVGGRPGRTLQGTGSATAGQQGERGYDIWYTPEKLKTRDR